MRQMREDAKNEKAKQMKRTRPSVGLRAAAVKVIPNPRTKMEARTEKWGPIRNKRRKKAQGSLLSQSGE